MATTKLIGPHASTRDSARSHQADQRNQARRGIRRPSQPLRQPQIEIGQKSDRSPSPTRPGGARNFKTVGYDQSAPRNRRSFLHRRRSALPGARTRRERLPVLASSVVERNSFAESTASRSRPIQTRHVSKEALRMEHHYCLLTEVSCAVFCTFAIAASFCQPLYYHLLVVEGRRSATQSSTESGSTPCQLPSGSRGFA